MKNNNKNKNFLIVENNKTKNMHKFLNEMSMQFFGRMRKENQCVVCGKDVDIKNDFVDEISLKEFYISRMCQKCQDGVFNNEDEM